MPDLITTHAWRPPPKARADGVPVPGRPAAVRLTRVFAVTPHTGRKLRAGASRG